MYLKRKSEIKIKFRVERTELANRKSELGKDDKIGLGIAMKDFKDFDVL